MRGNDITQNGLFSYVSLEDRIPKHHPIRKIRALVDGVLASMDDTFESLYDRRGRESIPPERLLRALLLQVLYTVRSERALMERLDFDLMFRWFVGLNMDEQVWDRTTFSHNRERVLNQEVARVFFDRIVHIAQWAELTSHDHFSVDGSLIDAWASHKSFKPKDGSDGDNPPGRNPDVDFRAKQRLNDTHESSTDPQSRMFRKGRTGAGLRYMVHALIENRNGLLIDVDTTQATGTAERDAAMAMVQRRGIRGGTLGADKGYDANTFAEQLRARGIRPHLAAKAVGSAMDGRTTRHDSYKTSQRRRKIVEEVFGWAKTVGGLRKTRFKGLARVNAQCLLTMAAFNIVRISTLNEWAPPARAT